MSSDSRWSGVTASNAQNLSLAGGFRAVRRVRRARRVALFNGWSEVVFGGLAVLFGIFSLTSLVTGIALLLVARVELRGARRLGRLDPQAPVALARNQLVLLAGVLVYCGWQMYAGLTGPTLLERYPDLRQVAPELGGDLDGMMRTVVIGVYGTVAVLSVVMQGLTARYYLRQRGVIVLLRSSRMRGVLCGAPSQAA